MPSKNPETVLLEALEALPSGARLFLACSGGLDSSSMAAALFSLKKARKISCPVTLVHINHALRGIEAKKDASFVVGLGKKYKFPVVSKTLLWKKGEKKSQNIFRQKRKQIFSALMQGPKDFLLTAHHKDDQVETFFLRLLRGTGLKGLRLMEKHSEGQLKPWLSIGKCEILAYAQQKKISWREDQSNQENSYDRNWLRNEIFPLLEKRNPKFGERILALVEEIRSLEEKSTLSPLFIAGSFSLYALEDAKKLRQQELFALLPIPSRKHVQGVYKFLQEKQGKYPAPGYLIWISQGFVLFGKGTEADWLETLKSYRKRDRQRLVSALGEWRTSVPADFEKTASYRDLLKEKLPSFFRTEVPVASFESKNIFLLPKYKKFGFEFMPSRIGQLLTGISKA